MKYDIETTQTFDNWLRKVRDKTVLHRFDVRFNRMAKGNLGDFKQIGIDLFEIRFFFGSGYRMYFTIREGKIILLLCGGDKGTQDRDIVQARGILSRLR